MKLTLPAKRLLSIILIAIFSIGLILFLTCINLFLFQEWNFIQWIIIGIWVIVSILIAILTPNSIYYFCTKKYVEETKFNKKLVYNYSDIIYINEELSLKKKKVIFYTRFGHVKELFFDKKNVLYQSMLINCKNRLTKEEFERKYPNVRW